MNRWRCPICGFTCDGISLLPIHCKCGYVDEGISNNFTEIDATNPPRQAPQRVKRHLHCSKRSTEFRLVECPTCVGKIMMKVYKCELYGECSISHELEGIHVCNGGVEAA